MGAGPGSVVGGVVDNLVYKVLAKTEGVMAVKQAKWVAVGAVICLMAASAGGAALHLGGQRVPLELTVLGDESDPVKTVSCMESLAQMGITAYLGGVGSHLHAAAAAVAEKNQIPYCGVGFALWSIHQRGNKYLFSPFPKSPELAVETYPHPQRVRPCSKPAPARGDLRRTQGLGQGTSRPVGDPVSGVRLRGGVPGPIHGGGAGHERSGPAGPGRRGGAGPGGAHATGWQTVAEGNG